MQKFLILLILLVTSAVSNALVEIPLPDMSKSEASIVKKHGELIEAFNSVKGELEGIKLGSLYGEMAMFYQAHEFTNAAKICYQNAMEVSPYDYRWQYLLGFVESSLGNFERAMKLYESVININKDYLVAKIRWAELELEAGNFEKSKKLFNEVLQRAPDYSKAIVGLGTISMQNGDAQSAVDFYLKALALQPKANQLNYLLSQAYSSMGKEKEANKYLKSAGQRSVVMYDKILQDMRLHSVSAVYYSQASINAFMHQDYRLSEELVKHSIALDPNNINPKFTLMNVYLSTNRSEQALKLAQGLLVKNPKDDRLTYSLGLIHEIEGDDKKAIEWYQKTLQINKKHKTALLVLANAQMRLKQYNNALTTLRKSQQLDSENPYPLYAEASILSRLKVCDKSIAKYLESLKKLADENFTYLVGFVKTVAMCDVADQQIKNDALNAARNMYFYAPSLPVVQALAMIEATFGHKKEAVDYQTQAIFQGLTQNLSKAQMESMQEDLMLFRQGKKVMVAIKPFDVDINPVRAADIN